MRTSLVYPLAAGLVLALAAAAVPARAITDLERLEQLEQEVALLKRKMEVQQEDATAKAATTPVVGAGPDGFFLRSPDSKYILRLRGYAQADTRWLVDSDDSGNDTFLMRARPADLRGHSRRRRRLQDHAGLRESQIVLFDAYGEPPLLPEKGADHGRQVQAAGRPRAPPVGHRERCSPSAASRPTWFRTATSA